MKAIGVRSHLFELIGIQITVFVSPVIDIIGSSVANFKHGQVPGLGCTSGPVTAIHRGIPNRFSGGIGKIDAMAKHLAVDDSIGGPQH